MRYLTLVSFIVFSFAAALRSQSPYVTHYTTENGLPSNGIKGMAWDAERQLLWLATEAGILRFNGQFFTVFDQGNSPWLHSNRIGYLGKMRGGAVFGTSETDVLFAIDGLKPQPNIHLSWGHSIPAKSFYVFEDPLALERTDLMPWQGLKGFTWPAFQLVGYQDEQLFIRRDSSLFRFCPGMAEPEIYDTLFSSAQWFSIGEELFLLDEKGNSWSYQPGAMALSRLPSPWQEEILRRSETHPEDWRVIWRLGQKTPILLSGNTAWALRWRRGGLQADFISDAVPANSYFVFAHYWEEGRQLFLATDAKGFYQLRQPLVRQWTEPRYGDPARSKSSYSQVLLPSGNILTQNGQVFGPHAQPTFPDWFGRGNIGRNIHVHPNGEDLLFSCQDTLYHCSGNADSCRPMYHLHGLDLAAFYPLRAQEQLLASRGSEAVSGGIWHLRKNSTIRYHTFRESQEELPHFYALFPWADHQFALATCSGLWLFDTLARQLDTLPGTEELCIRTTWRYRDYLFLGTYGDGIWVYRNGRLRSLPIDPQKYLLYAHCFQPDGFGYVWIPSNRGLFRAHLDDLLEAADGLDQQIFYRYFGLKEGMSFTELNGGCSPCALELPDGRLSFPTMDGLLWVDPASLTDCFPQAEPYFEAVLTGDYDLTGEGEVRFSRPLREVNLQLEYSYFGNSESNYLYYRLLPDRPDWKLIDARNPHELRLTGLSPGTHRLQLRKLNGYDQFAQREMVLHIPGPWYLSWYAFVLYAAVISLLVWLVYQLAAIRYRRRQRQLEALVAEKTWEVQEKNSELEHNIRQLKRQQAILNQASQLKNRLVSILNHDIITPLRFMHLTGRKLVHDKARMPAELQDELLVEIAHTAEELEHLSTNILNWIRYQDLRRPELVRRETNLYALAEQVRKLLAPAARSKDTRIRNAIPPDTLVRIPVEPFQIILHNLVSNSLKFTPGGHIEMGMLAGTESWSLYVRDNGQGMSPAQVDNILRGEVVHSSPGPDQVRGHGLGYLIIRELVQLLGGTLQVESRPGFGTKVIIELPIAKEQVGAATQPPKDLAASAVASPKKDGK